VASSHPAVFPLGFGRALTATEIDEADIDVKPDGTGLPPGSGTVDEGAEVYAARCASCHGPDGLGTPAGWPLVGRNPGDAFDFHQSLANERRRTVGNYWPYATTLFDYTRRAMPYDAPGSLMPDEVYAVTAWILWRNRIIGHEEVMDRETLPEVLMPAHDRFIPDDRVRPPR
jgi:cytochrome c